MAVAPLLTGLALPVVAKSNQLENRCVDTYFRFGVEIEDYVDRLGAGVEDDVDRLGVGAEDCVDRVEVMEWK
jgi:hypothetical protein